MLAAVTGSRPRWYARPTTITLAAGWLAKTRRAMPAASSQVFSLARVAPSIAVRKRSSSGNLSEPRPETMAPVGTSAVLTTATVRSGAARLMFFVADNRSNTSMVSVDPSTTRFDAVIAPASSVWVMRRFDTPVPPF